MSVKFDKEKNLILEVEYGLGGGDEINLIEINKLNKDDPLYFGWAIVSAGEPLRTLVPSIAPSEITKIDENSYVLGTMGANKEQHKSMYFFQHNDEKKMINL